MAEARPGNRAPRRSPAALTLAALLALPPLCAWWEFKRPGPLAAGSTVLIRRGTTADRAADILHAEGVIRSPALFKLRARLWGDKILMGEYLFPRGASMETVAGMLEGGQIHVTRIVIPPSIHAWSLQKRLEPFVPEEAFWGFWASGKLREMAGFPDAPTLEGLVAPATYNVNRAMEPEEVMQELVRAFRSRVFPRLEGGPLPPYETLILASLAEKETAVRSELPHITGVFHNRLNSRMRLQCDPTSLYARWLEGDLRFTPPASEDILRGHPYNTYSVMGLPPGPIAIPSAAAIEAALSPMETEDYYFVANGKGGHSFSRTLREHNRNVRAYRAEVAGQRGAGSGTARAKKKAANKPRTAQRKR